jgi:hypothetical protein
MAKVRTQFNWTVDQVETCGKFPSLADPDAEVYTVAELIARHERGLLTNLNIGKQTAYPEFAHLSDRDLEKDLNQDATDQFHLMNELDEQLRPQREAAEASKLAQDELERKKREDDAFEARIASEGFIKPEQGKGEGKT